MYQFSFSAFPRTDSKNHKKDTLKFNFEEKLYLDTKKKCNDYLTPEELTQGKLTLCQKDLMIASSCVLLEKANTNMGDFRGQLFDCKHEIELVKNNLKRNFDNFPFHRMDKWLKNQSISLYSYDHELQLNNL